MWARKIKQVCVTGRRDRQSGKAGGTVEGTNRSNLHKRHTEGAEREEAKVDEEFTRSFTWKLFRRQYKFVFTF
jgi:hypothetical protein